MTCGGDFAFNSPDHKVRHRVCAGDSLLFIGMSALGVLVAHGLARAVWRVLPWTKAKPLPEFLVFPVPELLLAGLLVMPLGVAAATLLMRVEDAGSLVLGALSAALLLAYLGLVGAVLLGVSARRELLGLRYVQHSQRGNAEEEQQLPGSTGQLDVALDYPDYDQPGKLTAIAVESTAKQPSPAADGPSGRGSMHGLLLRVAPRHAAGYWERPDVVMQQELRRTYQGGSQPSQVTWLGALLHAFLTHAAGLEYASSGPGLTSAHPLGACTPTGTRRATVRLVSSLIRLKASGLALAEQAGSKVRARPRCVPAVPPQACPLALLFICCSKLAP
jgi:hypothetical protein